MHSCAAAQSNQPCGCELPPCPTSPPVLLRYNSPWTTRRRIWDSYTVPGQATHINHVGGHHSDLVGVYYRDSIGWMVYPGVYAFGRDWLLSVEQYQSVRFQRAYVASSTTAGLYKAGFTINHGASGETSDWGVALAIFYERELNITERLQVRGLGASRWLVLVLPMQ